MSTLDHWLRPQERSEEKEIGKVTERGHSRANTRFVIGVVLVFVLLFLGQGQVAYAATITVNTTDDELNSDGDCSLREAIQAANTDAAIDACTAGSGADTIVVPAGTYTLSITGAGDNENESGDLDITDSLSISGVGAGSTIINGNGIDGVFQIFAGVTADISDVTITGGKAGDGGGIRIANNTSVTLTDVTVSGNTATDSGGIVTHGTLTLNRSTVSGNTADTGGGITNAGGMVTLNNSTVSGNTGNDNDAAFENNGTLILNNSTVSGNNTRIRGGGINGNTTLKNTIVANNTPDDCLGTSITSVGHNLIEDATGCAISGDTTGNIIGVDPLLGPLADNGGSTQTHALLAGSPAIDAGSSDCPPPATDQRGVARPQGTACDIGAFELVQNQPPVADAGGPYTVDESDSVSLDGSGSFDPDPGDTLTYEWDLDYDGITFDVDATDPTPLFDATGLDGPSSRTIALRVTDNVGASDIDTAPVTINNVAPTADFANTSGNILEGEAATLAFSNPFDPSGADTAAGFQYSYDCTNDGAFELSDDPATSYICTYPNAGTFTARGRIKDKDGGFLPDDYTVEVIVLTPEEAIQDLIETVEELNLQQGIENNLDAKLDTALQALDDLNDNNDGAAINSLQACINAVEAQRGKALTDAQADMLIEMVQAIIDSLS